MEDSLSTPPTFKNKGSVCKYLTWFLLSFLVILMIAGLLVYHTPNRLGIGYRSLRTLKNASTASLSFRISMPDIIENDFLSLSPGFSGTFLADLDGEQTLLTLGIGQKILPLTLTFYQDPANTLFLKNPLVGHWWMTINESDESYSDLVIFYRQLITERSWRDLHYLMGMRRNDHTHFMVLSDDSYFSVEEVESFLASATSQKSEDIKKLNLVSYELEIHFNKNTHRLEHFILTGWFAQLDQLIPFSFEVSMDALNQPVDWVPRLNR